jgi:hypothetical protein
MSKFMVRGITVLVLVGFAAPAYAQTSAQATGSASIIQPISITKSTDLLFGTVAKPSSGSGTVAINATSGARSVGGGVTAVGAGTGRATFAVAGDANRAFSATVPASFTLGNGVPADNITVTLTGDTPLTLDGSGAAVIGVGGSFTLASGQTVGAYTGNFTVSVAYN